MASEKRVLRERKIANYRDFLTPEKPKTLREKSRKLNYREVSQSSGSECDSPCKIFQANDPLASDSDREMVENFLPTTTRGTRRSLLQKRNCITTGKKMKDTDPLSVDLPPERSLRRSCKMNLFETDSDNDVAFKHVDLDKILRTPPKQADKQEKCLTTPRTMKTFKEISVRLTRLNLSNTPKKIEENEANEEKKTGSTRRSTRIRKEPIKLSLIKTTTPRTGRVVYKTKSPRKRFNSGSEIIHVGESPRKKPNKLNDDNMEDSFVEPFQESSDEWNEENDRDSSSDDFEQERTPPKPERKSMKIATPRTPALKSSQKSILNVFNRTTPRTGKRIQLKHLTPSVDLPALRRTEQIVMPKTPLEKATRSLHVGNVPDVLPCREKEFEDVHNFVYGKLVEGCSGCMYIAGVPGTGKTATVTDVVKNIKDLAGTDVPHFKYLEINAMRLVEPRQAYVEIYKQLTEKLVSWAEAFEQLRRIFTEQSNMPVIMLLDELDMLHTKRQDVIYNILDWTTHENSKLVVIAISNTMDLPERILSGRVSSRLGFTRLAFQPYTFKQLSEIIKSRLDKNIFHSDAIQLVARKIASVSGDVRRALDICRRAAEIKMRDDHPLVSIMHVNQAFHEMNNKDEVKSIRALPVMQKTYLKAIIAEIQRTGVEEVSLHSVEQQLKTLCVYENLPTLTSFLIKYICNNLASQNIISLDHHSKQIFNIRLNFSQDDILFGLNDDLIER